MSMSVIQPIAPIEKLSFDPQAQSVGNTASVNIPFSGVLQEAVANLEQANQVAAQDSYDLALGNTDDLAGIMINMSKQTAALEYTVQLSTRVVNAYKEVMQMQV